MSAEVEAARVAIITGASSGVGAVLARRLAAQGWRVAAIGRDEGRLAAVAGPGISTMVVDIRDAQAVEAMVDRVEAELGPVAALVNNAAVFANAPLGDQSEDEIRAIVDTTVYGTLWCSRAVGRRMRPRRAGRIINVASVAGTRGIAGQAVYCAAKHAMVGLSASLGQEWLADGITVSALCPGGIDTPLWRGPGGENRYPGDPSALMSADEVAEAIEFVLTRRAGTLLKSMVFFPVCEWH